MQRYTSLRIAMYYPAMVSGPPPFPLPEPRGVDNAPDQVKRRRAFEAAHPEWRICYDKDYRVFRAWRLLDGGEDNLTRYELRDLLDALEER